MSRFVLVLLGVISISNRIDCIINGRKVGRTVLKEYKNVIYPTKEFPYMAALEFKDRYICGVVLIREDRVLTAAHCILKCTETTFTVRAGTFTKEDDCGKFVQTRNVTKKIVYPKYNGSSDEYDIAILELDSPFLLSDYIKPIKLANSNQVESFNFENAIALGFGNIEHHFKTSNLRMVDLKVFSKAACKDKHSAITKNMICTMGYDQPAGVNNGDSGGPLVIQNLEQDVLIGIIANCISTREPPVKCNTDFPSVYADIAVFRRWIDENV